MVPQALDGMLKYGIRVDSEIAEREGAESQPSANTRTGIHTVDCVGICHCHLRIIRSLRVARFFRWLRGPQVSSDAGRDYT